MTKNGERKKERRNMKGGDETDPLVLRSGPPPLAAKQTCTDRGGSLSPATTNLVLASDGVLLPLLSLLLLLLPLLFCYNYYYYYYYHYFSTYFYVSRYDTRVTRMEFRFDRWSLSKSIFLIPPRFFRLVLSISSFYHRFP